MIRSKHRRGWFRWLRREPQGFEPPRTGWLTQLTFWFRRQLDMLLLGSDRPAWEASQGGGGSWWKWLTVPIWGPFWLVWIGLLTLVYGLLEILLRLVQPVGGVRLLHLLAASPAIAALGFAGWCVIRMDLQQEKLVRVYERLAEEAADREDFDAASLFWQRVIDEKDDADSRFRYADVLDRMGQKDDALALMRRLAPEKREGHPRAHKYMALRYAASLGSFRGDAQNALVLAERTKWHLEKASDQDSANMQFAWASYYVACGDVYSAIERLEGVVEDRPEMYHVLGELYGRVGRLEEARSSLQSAARHYNQSITNDPANADARADLADVLIRLGRAGTAVNVLKQGLGGEDDERLRRLVGTAFAYLFDEEVSKSENRDYSLMLSHLRSAFEYDPGNVHALERLTRLGLQQGPEQRKSLRGMIERTDGKSPAMVHFVLAIMDYADEQRDASAWHLEQALKINSRQPFVLNNLAVLLMEQSPPELDRASELIATALQIAPNEPRLLDTRGQVLAARGEFGDAIAAFESALTQMPQTQAKLAARINGRIAAAYDALGMDSLAQAHRDKAKAADSPSPDRRP